GGGSAVVVAAGIAGAAGAVGLAGEVGACGQYQPTQRLQWDDAQFGGHVVEPAPCHGEEPAVGVDLDPGSVRSAVAVGAPELAAVPTAPYDRTKWLDVLPLQQTEDFDAGAGRRDLGIAV